MNENTNKKPPAPEKGHEREADPLPSPLTGSDPTDPTADQTEGSDGGGAAWLSKEERKKAKVHKRAGKL